MPVRLMNPENILGGRAVHDMDMFARVPASGSTAEQPSTDELLNGFEDERETEFKEETYLVRDNGAVLRQGRADARRRKLDDVWTFGTLNKHSGYLVISEHVVHQIVATAYHGARPSNDHVVDHIDTNRLNNRPENLRWVTRLENVLLNPITRRRIELAFGSLEAFFDNPGASAVPNLEWMRTVTKEQATESRRRLMEWAEKGRATKGGSLGDWLFAPRAAPDAPPEPEPEDVPSLTQAAFQRNWRTPTEFPQCPDQATAAALEEYLERLSFGTVFARNRYGGSIVVAAAIGADNVMSVLCNTQTGIKDWTLAKVFIEGEAFCHESGGMFFTLQGALKAHCAAIGEEFGESIDDYA